MQRTSAFLGGLLQQIDEAIANNRESIDAIPQISSNEILRVIGSGLATGVTGFLFSCQLFAFLINLDTVLVRMSSFVYQHCALIGSESSTFMKCLLTLMFLRQAYGIHLSEFRSSFMVLVSIRSGIECITHQMRQLHEEHNRTWTQFLSNISVTILVTLATLHFTSQFIFLRERGLSNAQLLIILVEWLAGPVVNLLISILTFALNSPRETLNGMFIASYSNFSLSLAAFCSVLFYVIDSTSNALSYWWTFCLVFHNSIPILSRTIEIAKVHRIALDLRNRFQPASVWDIDQLSSDDVCSICLSKHNYPSSVKLPCRHMVHEDCLLGMLKATSQEQQRCPVCRANIFSVPSLVQARMESSFPEIPRGEQTDVLTLTDQEFEALFDDREMPRGNSSSDNRTLSGVVDRLTQHAARANSPSSRDNNLRVFRFSVHLRPRSSLDPDSAVRETESQNNSTTVPNVNDASPILVNDVDTSIPNIATCLESAESISEQRTCEEAQDTSMITCTDDAIAESSKRKLSNENEAPPFPDSTIKSRRKRRRITK